MGLITGRKYIYKVDRQYIVTAASGGVIGKSGKFYPNFLPEQFELIPQIGDKLRIKDIYRIPGVSNIGELIGETTTEWIVQFNVSIYPFKYRHDSVSKIDIWNWFDIIDPTGPNTTEAIEKPRVECEPSKVTGKHEFVNVSFMSIDMRCKFCDKSEQQHDAEKMAEKMLGLEGY